MMTLTAIITVLEAERMNKGAWRWGIISKENNNNNNNKWRKRKKETESKLKQENNQHTLYFKDTDEIVPRS